MESHRKPYIRPVTSGWWLKRKEYIIYMLRELTAVIHLWIVAELLTIILAAVFANDPQAWIAGFVQNPAVLVMNILTFPATILHTVTWYNIFPKGVRVFMSKRPDDTRLLPAKYITIAGYCMTVAATAVILFALA